MEFCAPLSVKKKAWRLRAAAPLPRDLSPDMSPQAASVALSRGFDLPRFFEPTLRNCMPEPFDLLDMERAVVAVAAAIREGHPIGIIGDYDVDGATSTAILTRLLGMAGHRNVVWRVPHRIRDGYGPNPRIVAEMAAAGVGTLIVADSGTAAPDVIAGARGLGMQVVVLDHHEAHERLPDCILVNPKRPDGDRSHDYLCTAGLSFLFAVALRRHLKAEGIVADMDLHGILGLVALGTIADVVPLVGLNRSYVATGMRRLAEIPGIAALCEAMEEEKFTPRTCGFVFGPCLNAAGRLEDMSLGVELLLSPDVASARPIAARLKELNERRRTIQKDAVDAAREMVESRGLPSVIVVRDDAWHPGVVGLVAARIKEAFDRPAIAIGTHGKGSGRSVDGFDLGHAVIEAASRGLLAKGGGHAMAAGLTIDPPQLERFAAFMAESAKDFVAPPVDLDLAFPCGGLRADTVDALSRLEPFGAGNAEPRLAVAGGTVAKARILKDSHVKVTLRSETGDTDAIAFGCMGTPLGEALTRGEGRRMDVYGRASLDVYGGRRSVSLRIDDAMVA